MKFVAAARLRQRRRKRPWQRALTPRELARVLRSTMARIETPEHPLLAKRPENNILAIVLTGERGLAGAFNSNVLRKAHEFFRGHPGKKITTIPVGKKRHDSLRRAGFTFAAEYVNVLARVEGLQNRSRNRQPGRGTLYQGRNRFRIHYLQRIQKRDGSHPGGRETFASEAIREDENENGAENGRKKKSPTKLPSTTSTSNPKSKSWQNCCRAMSKRRSSAPCWNRPPPNTPRA